MRDQVHKEQNFTQNIGTLTQILIFWLIFSLSLRRSRETKSRDETRRDRDGLVSSRVFSRRDRLVTAPTPNSIQQKKGEEGKGVTAHIRKKTGRNATDGEAKTRIFAYTYARAAAVRKKCVRGASATSILLPPLRLRYSLFLGNIFRLRDWLISWNWELRSIRVLLDIENKKQFPLEFPRKIQQICRDNIR